MARNPATRRPMNLHYNAMRTLVCVNDFKGCAHARYNLRVMKKVRWGVLGVANIAVNRVIPSMQAGQLSEIVGIASRNRAKADEAAARLGIRKAYGSYEE